MPHGYRSLKGKPGSGGTPGPYIQKQTGIALFDLKNDIGETTDVADKHPKIVARLKQIAAEARKDLGDNGRKGKGQRAPGKLTER